MLGRGISLVLCCSAVATLRVPSAVRRLSVPVTVNAPRAPPPRLNFIPPAVPDDGYDDNTDESPWDNEGCDDWEAAMAEQAAWEKAMAEEKTGKAADENEPAAEVVDDTSDEGFVFVDESAWFDDADDDDETPAQRSARQLQEKQAFNILQRAGAAAAAPPPDRVMTSLESVLNTMMRLEKKVDKLTAKVEQLQAGRDSAATTPLAAAAAAPSPAGPGAPAATPSEPEWDGEVDESAWFDEDPDEDLPDWREVRAAKLAADPDAYTPRPAPASPPSAPAAAPPTTSAAPEAGASSPSKWDGVEDESAYFDDDGADLPDWRDVRALKRMLDLDLDPPADPADPTAPKPAETDEPTDSATDSTDIDADT